MARNGWQTATSVFLLGVGVGAGIGLLFAPKSGEDTRDDIVGAAKDGVDGVISQASRLNRRAQKTIEDAKERVKGAIEVGEQAYREAKNVS